jgi:DNA-binding response OmpR family regulator
MRWQEVEEEAPVVPRILSPEQNDDDATQDAPRRPAQPVSADAATILVVDDDLANLAVAEALLVLKTCTPALILMDIQLPEVDGWELTRQLKADPATSRIPVIAITAYGNVGDEQKARQAGFVEFLPKPVSTRELPTIVRRHLATH